MTSAMLVLAIIAVATLAVAWRKMEQRLSWLEHEGARLTSQLARQETRHADEMRRLWEDFMGTPADLLDMTDGSVSAYLEDHRN